MVWLQLPEEDRRNIINQASAQIGISPQAVEKDWWVTLALRALFATEYAPDMIFKGGTSLSKGWDLIKRFSEDIDIGFNRKILGYDGPPKSKSQLQKLRKDAHQFVATKLKEALEKAILGLGVKAETFKLIAQEDKPSDFDPHTLELHYTSLVQQGGYLVEKVLIEVGARSLMEPTELRPIQSIIGSVYKGRDFADEPFRIPIVLPKRTFLEKVFLLHEEFSKPPEKIRFTRMSRHLYDIECIMDMDHGKDALADKDLFAIILEHRTTFTPIDSVDYGSLTPALLDFLPPENMAGVYEEDYKVMRENMIYVEAITFPNLIDRLKELKARFGKL